MRNEIHSSVVFTEPVKMGSGNSVGPYCALFGSIEIGDSNWIGTHVAIGTPGEVRRELPHRQSWRENSGGLVVIGSRNVIREFVTIQVSPGSVTRIGSDCYIMAKSHIPHDAVIGDMVTLSPGVFMGGHVQISDGATIGLGAVVHQRIKIGSGAMIGMGAVVTRDIPPFAKAYGNPCKVHGVNYKAASNFNLGDADLRPLESAYVSSRMPGEDEIPDSIKHFFAPEQRNFHS